MTVQEIKSRVEELASARLPEVVGRVFSSLINHHAHNSWRGECNCSYCRFINEKYGPRRMGIRRFRKRVNLYLDIYEVNFPVDECQKKLLAKADELKQLKQEKERLKAEFL